MLCSFSSAILEDTGSLLLVCLVGLFFWVRYFFIAISGSLSHPTWTFYSNFCFYLTVQDPSCLVDVSSAQLWSQSLTLHSSLFPVSRSSPQPLSVRRTACGLQAWPPLAWCSADPLLASLLFAQSWPYRTRWISPRCPFQYCRGPVFSDPGIRVRFFLDPWSRIPDPQPIFLFKNKIIFHFCWSCINATLNELLLNSLGLNLPSLGLNFTFVSRFPQTYLDLQIQLKADPPDIIACVFAETERDANQTRIPGIDLIKITADRNHLT